MTSEVLAPAKINLALHVTGQRADGYHTLDSLVVFARVFDRLRFAKAGTMELTVGGPFAAGVPTDSRNLVWRAAETAGWTGHIHLEKNLPHGGGLGGGSADAAAVLRTLGGTEHAVSLGADVPVCLGSRAARMSGIGEDITLLKDDLTFFAVLVNPALHVPTPAVFKALKSKNNAPLAPMPHSAHSLNDWLDWLKLQRNDLQAPAMALEPRIADVLDALKETPDILLARMSGSGSTCFGLYPTIKTAHAAAKALQAANPDWWCVETVLS
jgi:4-diphosphocytidyl-2-C-methyl-D-erythritol kinase